MESDICTMLSSWPVALGPELWPLSRKQKPKQSLRLVGGQSMFQHAVRRILPIFPIDRIFIATRQEHKELLHAARI